MYNFELKNPVKILFGKGQITNIDKEIPQGVKILLTYGGGSIKKNGVYQQVKEALTAREVIEFGGIEPNPHYETCMEAVQIIKAEGIDYILSVGGGSVLDGTKFIAAAALWEGNDPWEILALPAPKPVTKAMPLGAVLTLPATGSEMNGNAVITRWETKEKLAFASPLVMPQFSVLDPETIYSLPDKQVANGIVDAFIHVMEQYLTYPVNAKIQDRFAEAILLNLIEEGPKYLKNRTDYDSAANFMWSATMALNGLIGAGVPQDWATHMIGHELTAFHGIDHGRTLAIVLPGIMHIRREQKKDKILQYGERIWGISEGTETEKINLAISKTVDFFESLGVPTKLSDYNVPAESITKIVNRFKERGLKLSETGDLAFDEIEKVLKNRL